MASADFHALVTSTLAIAFAISALFGAVARHTHFCTMGAISDAVSLGDYHVARSIGWALVGEQTDDDAAAELLQPYAGHRYRVQRLLELAGVRHPQHGPRMAPRAHLPR